MSDRSNTQVRPHGTIKEQNETLTKNLGDYDGAGMRINLSPLQRLLARIWEREQCMIPPHRCMLFSPVAVQYLLLKRFMSWELIRRCMG